MATYEITYVPNGLADRSGLDTKVEAELYRESSKFLSFYRDGSVVLKVASAQVLQVKLVEEGGSR